MQQENFLIAPFNKELLALRVPPHHGLPTEEVKGRTFTRANKWVRRRRRELSRSDHRVRSSSGISGFGDLGQDYKDGFRRGVVPKGEVSHVKRHVTRVITSKDYTSQTRPGIERDTST